MQYIRDILAAKRQTKRPVISLEFFPPKTDEGEKNLLKKAIPALLEIEPDYCSVTYGAGGSTREKTLMIVDQIQRDHKLTAMAHLTCVSATREQTQEAIAQIKSLGIRNILALRGDPPAGSAEFTKPEGGFGYASELVHFIRELNGFCVGVAGFPEGHVACAGGRHADWQHLKEKIEQGADFVLTQLFFDNTNFFEFWEHMTKKLNVAIPICPGIVPIQSGAQIKRFTTMCGARLPAGLLSRLEELGDDDAAVTEFGIEYATRQCEELLRAGVPGIHFYTLNKAYSTVRIVRNLGLAPGA